MEFGLVKVSRRSLLSQAVGAAIAGGAVAGNQGVAAKSVEPPKRTDDFWSSIRAEFDTNGDFINLEHGYWTEMARPIREAFATHTEMINRDGAFYARNQWASDKAEIEARLAGYLKCKPTEIALTRNASEALQALIGGYRPLGRGDAVLHADLDYPSVIQDFKSLAASRGADVVKIEIPEPATYEGVIQAYEEALEKNPKIKLLVLTHVSNQTGLVVPVKEIIQRARANGVDVIVDAAHSWGQLDYSINDLDADFIAFNLHKWIGAPIGVGFVYIREDRLSDIARNISQGPSMEDKTAGRVYFGTMNFATALTVHDALDYNDRIGWSEMSAHLRSLRDVWAEPARSVPGVEVLTPTDKRLAGAITSFRLAGRTSADENAALANRLIEEFGIYTVFRPHPAKGACVRVTPALSNSPEDSEKLLAALRAIAG
ncbi:MAG: aminotransferase class V-fold PLP-dependent enzyme [Pseudomonadota bacterium]